MKNGSTYVFEVKEKKGSHSRKKMTFCKGRKALIELNTCTSMELQALHGIGPVLAQRIIDGRPFRSIQELQKIKGVGLKVYTNIQENIYIEEGEVHIKKESSDTLPIESVKLCPLNEILPKDKLHCIDINSCSKETLMKLKGIGPVLASRILESRPFSRNDELLSIKGIGAKTYSLFRDQLIDIEVQAPSVNNTSSTRIKQQEVPRDEEEDSTDGIKLIDKHIPFKYQMLLNYQYMTKDLRAQVLGKVQNHQPSSSSTFPEIVFVASWNIRNISKKRDVHHLMRIAEIINEFDLVALQEVRDLLVLKRLKFFLPNWDFVASPPIYSQKNKKRTEYYAFMYRKSKIQEQEGLAKVLYPEEIPGQVIKNGTRTFRPLFMGYFKTLTVQLRLINVHVNFGSIEERLTEVEEMRKILQCVDKVDQEEPKQNIYTTTFLLGDFNLAPHDIGTIHDRIPFIRPPLFTTVHEKLYDNIWMDVRGCLNPPYLSIGYGIYRIDWKYYPDTCLLSENDMDTMNQCDNDKKITIDNSNSTTRERVQTARFQCSNEISDHCPIWMVLTMSSLSTNTVIV
jgi:DNA uptake protein ComE-like DNA-binding protein/endonuclease/exonuclease/phosphatase family metal-dependent hydrolase